VYWQGFTANPSNWLEKKAPMRFLSRGKAALQTLQATLDIENPVVISHLPYMTAAISQALMLRKQKVRHMAFAFNFTQLPMGGKKTLILDKFKDIDRFTVFSSYEKEIYSDYFQIDPQRIRPILWAQSAPPIAIPHKPIFDQPYLCSIGGEGRDYNTLIKAAKINKIPLAIICRPHNLRNIDIPSNVKVFCNIPLADTWGIAKQSNGLILPIEDPKLCCGQITLVSAHMTGLQVITNNAYALSDYYVKNDIICEEKNENDLSKKMEQVISVKIDESLSNHVVQATIVKHDRVLWTQEIEEFLYECWGSEGLCLDAALGI